MLFQSEVCACEKEEKVTIKRRDVVYQHMLEQLVPFEKAVFPLAPSQLNLADVMTGIQA